MNASTFSIVNAYMMQENNSRNTLVLIVPLLIKYICAGVEISTSPLVRD